MVKKELVRVPEVNILSISKFHDYVKIIQKKKLTNVKVEMEMQRFADLIYFYDDEVKHYLCFRVEASQ